MSCCSPPKRNETSRRSWKRLCFIEGTTQSMDVHGKLELYIPGEAEVKSIRLWSLPNSMLRRMGLPLFDQEGSRMLSDSPEGIWICPAVIRKKGQKLSSNTGTDVTKNMSSLLGRQSQDEPGHSEMSIVAANRTAYKVLKEATPGRLVSSQTSHTSSLPQCSAPSKCKTVVVIYNGRIYLILPRKRNQSQRETPEPVLESQTSIPSTSAASSTRRNKLLSPADNEPQRKKRCVSSPQTSPDNLSTDQELINNKEKHTTWTVTHSENNSRCHDDGEQAVEEAGGTESVWFQPLEEQEEVEEMEANSDGGECEEHDLAYDEADYIQMDGDERDDSVGFVGPSSSHTWTRRESEGPASASTSMQDFDFKMLEEEEKIAQMKAKLRRSEAALNNLHAS